MSNEIPSIANSGTHQTSGTEHPSETGGVDVSDAIYAPITGEWWVPTEDAEWYQMRDLCTDTCHHPVHAFGHPERLRHLEKSSWLRRVQGTP